ncbi:hypothetical protein IST455A_04805 [Burkholderia multivorans]|uniref:hypothetical protein n=1 Tax=Burkholderia multivorans TaxID=87883 RepID=UPI0019A46DAA|nr:hypothetical protein [Burkholderia multivorans]CAB5285446.1 hypothetical protein IST419_04844 [Burkholderia multivorans]CAB5293687.1 hypothetical protein IST495A_05265 [Burkholderia multivorans]CAB5302348.1 hypothetical protein IST455A_04805 [Burkholderia multivorans]CAB5302524.1 hypothetical protein IST424_04675 [Burkholderia multivorans]CAB5303491.1 hypothetical protein IST453_04622 [Burkholderia multivorans]
MNCTVDTSPHDAALRDAIAAAASALHFNNRPGSIARQCTLGLFVAALSDRLALGFPESADALRALVFSPATPSNPADHTQQQPEHQQ